MDDLDPYEFEEFVANLWEAKGYETVVTPGSNDRGIDFEARKLGRKEIVQVKKYSPGNKVGAQEIRNYATLYQQVPDANTVVVVTSSSFTEQAKELANDLEVEIFDRERLMKEIQKHNRDESVTVAQNSSSFEVKGFVDFFNSTGGYGFIAAEGINDDVFFHMEDIDGPDLQKGEKVGLDVKDSPKGPRAKNVVRLDSTVPVNAESSREDVGCFIATAAYGTPTAEEINILRAFRDKTLRGSMLGEIFIRSYYFASPPIAEYISNSEYKQRFVRERFVQPLVNIVKKL